MINLLHGDCLVLMKDIPDNSIDMVLTDPPYGTTDCKWDYIIPFDLMWFELKRIIKPNGVICLFGSEPFSSNLRLSNFNQYRYDWYWEKSKPSLYQHAKNRPMRAIELISVFSEAKWGHMSQVKNRMTYLPQGVIDSGIKTVSKNQNAGRVGSERPNQIGKKYMSQTGFPRDILKFPNLTGRSCIHPTQKPVPLLEYLIKTYTIEGETVIDFTMGSGSTGVACRNLKRNFIGIELDKDYFEIANDRIHNGPH